MNCVKIIEHIDPDNKLHGVTCGHLHKAVLEKLPRDPDLPTDTRRRRVRPVDLRPLLHVKAAASCTRFDALKRQAILVS